jgi:hypothetical protein
MGIFHSVIVARLIFVLGIVNVLAAMLIFFSCRCIPGSRLLSKLTKHAAYNRFFKYHCYIWWIFWPSVIVHAVLAFAFFGIPV